MSLKWRERESGRLPANLIFDFPLPLVITGMQNPLVWEMRSLASYFCTSLARQQLIITVFPISSWVGSPNLKCALYKVYHSKIIFVFPVVSDILDV